MRNPARQPRNRRIPSHIPRIIRREKQARTQAAKAAPNAFEYKYPQHETLPHVVKFSGGRSSGMLLITLLHNKLLKAERGDVVVFNNTSAEHPATYEFVRKCKKECEKHGVPFFWTEFQTYETARDGIYTRLPSYRLVNDRPYSTDNPNGYHHCGEVFEELISWKGFLPNNFSGRICTSLMKLFVSKEFLRDWFALKEGIERLGHFGERSRIDPDEEHAEHLRNRGGVPKEIFIAKKAFCWSRPLHRLPAQYADYSSVADYRKINNENLIGKQAGGKVKLGGDDSVDFCSFVGFRSDEPYRIARMRARINEDSSAAEENSGDMDYYIKAPEGEHVYAPLIDMDITKEKVANFWESHDFNLALPPDANLSNCVYCFLKGGNSLWKIANRQNSVNRKLPAGQRAKPGTPADIQWWVDIEKKYGRDLVAENRKISNPALAADIANGERPIIGFFDIIRKQSYGHLQAMSEKFKGDNLRGKKRNIMLSEYQNLPCDCTD